MTSSGASDPGSTCRPPAVVEGAVQLPQWWVPFEDRHTRPKRMGPSAQRNCLLRNARLRRMPARIRLRHRPLRPRRPRRRFRLLPPFRPLRPFRPPRPRRFLPRLHLLSFQGSPIRRRLPSRRCPAATHRWCPRRLGSASSYHRSPHPRSAARRSPIPRQTLPYPRLRQYPADRTRERGCRRQLPTPRDRVAAHQNRAWLASYNERHEAAQQTIPAAPGALGRSEGNQ